ncbi:MAG: GPR endopeptidase [Clostridia bacterium]|nr:GPR endopeptidase [Clostridia bacterium]
MQYRTDLAMERVTDGISIPGVRMENASLGDFSRNIVTIETDEAARQLQKAKGRYITFHTQPLKTLDAVAIGEFSKLIAGSLKHLLPPEGDILIVGLGNRRITSDALGSKVTDAVLVTRHLKDVLPQSLFGRLRGVCALSPGVLGVTGMETKDIVRGAVMHAKPAAVIAVDALAARECSRIGTTVQLSDTGIQPGSGVGNHRQGLTFETLGVPVISVGVPLVVYTSVIVRDALHLLLSDMEESADEKEAAADSLSRRITAEELGEMVVTPREIDELVTSLSNLLALSLNTALQPGLSEEEITMLTHETL